MIRHRAAALALLVAQTVVAAPSISVDAHETIPGVSAEPITQGAGLKSPQDLEALFDGVIGSQLKSLHYAGATVAVVKDGQLYFAKGYGFADVEKQIPVVAERTLFRMGSTCKLFTWTALMQLIEQGKVDLDADINTYLTDSKVPATFPEPITIRNLFTHTPGLEDAIYGWGFKPDAQHLVGLERTLAEHRPARVRAPATNFNDATMASYSNWGAATAGLIVQKVSGMTYDDYMDKNVFGPLGMTSSTFREPPPGDLAARLSTGYKYKNGVLEPQPFEHIHDIEPAGAMMATATDVARFMIAHLNNGAIGDARILKEESAKAMHARQLSPNPYVAGGGFGFYEEWMNGRRLIGHNGETQWFQTAIRLLPEDNVGVFISYNTAAAVPVSVRTALMQAFMDRYYPAKLPNVMPPQDFAKRAARYEGWYRFTRHAYTTNEKAASLLGAIHIEATKDNTLLYTLPPLGWQSQLVEVRPDVFRNQQTETMYAFTGDDHGKATFMLVPIGMPFISAYRLQWYEAPPFQNLVLGFGALCALVALVSWARNRKRDRQGPTSARWARRSAALVAVLHALFLLFFVAGLSAFGSNPLGELPQALHTALIFPLAAIPLTLAVIVCAFLVWPRSGWTIYQRCQFTLLSLGFAGLLWSLNYWNLVGFKFS